MIKTVHVCDFCGADEHKVEKVVKGPYVPWIGPVCICDECVDLCVGIIKGEGTGEDLDALRLDAARYRALRFGSSVPLQHDTDVGFKLYSTNWRGNGFAKIEIVTPESLDAGADLLIEKEKNNDR